MQMWQPAQTESLLYLMYGLFALTVVAMVAAFILQFGSALKDNPVKALKSLLGVILLVVVMIVAWSMGSGEQMNIPGYSGTDNVPFWLKVTVIVQIGAAFGLRLGLFLLENVERCTAAQRDDQQDDEDAAHAALFLRFLGGGFCRLSGDFGLPPPSTTRSC